MECFKPLTSDHTIQVQGMYKSQLMIITILILLKKKFWNVLNHYLDFTFKKVYLIKLKI